MPMTAIRNHDSAARCVAPSPPASSAVIGPAQVSPSTTTTTPTPTASQDAWTPSLTASAGRPAPYHRAARDVVPYSTNVPTTVSSAISAPAIPRPASGTEPRWPTTAVSTRT